MNDSKEIIEDYDSIREQLDYNYYPIYSRQRLDIHDLIINWHFEKVHQLKKHDEPWLIYMCGCYGSGKTHSINELKLFSENCVLIDPDKIKCMLSEQSKSDIKRDNSYSQSLDDNQKFHLESTYISSIIEKLVVMKGYNAIIDMSLHDADWYAIHLKNIKLQYSKYKLCIIKVNCDLPKILERCKSRGLVTGRTIPESYIKKIFAKIPESHSILVDLFDGVIEIDNYDKPKMKTSNLCMDNEWPWK